MLTPEELLAQHPFRVQSEPAAVCGCGFWADKGVGEGMSDVHRHHIAALFRERESQVLREAADDVPVTLWTTYGGCTLVQVEGFQAWLRTRAEKEHYKEGRR